MGRIGFGGRGGPVRDERPDDGEGQVCVPVYITGTRPDGRSFDDQQVLLLQIDGGRVRTADQFVGDPAAVTEFWA